MCNSDIGGQANQIFGAFFVVVFVFSLAIDTLPTGIVSDLGTNSGQGLDFINGQTFLYVLNRRDVL